MKKTKLMKFAGIAASAVMACGFLAGCGATSGTDSGTTTAGSSETTTAAATSASSTSASGTSTGSGNPNAELYYTQSGHTQGTFTTDPAVAYQGANTFNLGITETLFNLDLETREVKPSLATEYKQVDDTTWEITIRDGVKFSNGKELTAEACKKALEYTFGANSALAIANVSSFEANGQTLTIKTDGISAILPRILTSSDCIIFDTEASSDYSKGLIGTGPYILQNMDAEGNCDMVRNDDYWQGTPGVAAIHAKTGIETAQLASALQSGEIDWAGVADSDLQLFENNPDYTIETRNASRVYYLYINPNYTFTEDNAVRDALQHAFDREAILEGVYKGHGSVTDCIFVPDSKFRAEQTKDTSYNVDEAKKILADAGYTDSNGDGIVEKDGQAVKLNITTYKANNFPNLCEALQNMLKEIGIDSEIVVSEQIMDELGKGEFNIATYGYNTETYGDCLNYLEPVYGEGGNSNFNKFNVPEVNDLLAKLKEETDESKRAEYAKEIQKYIYDANDHIYLMHVINSTVFRKGINNVTFGLGGMDMSQLWKITKD